MKTVFITGDSWITDATVIMNNLEYLFSQRQLPEEFQVITTNAPGVEATIAPILVDAGIPVESVTELPEEIDYIVVMLSGGEERPDHIMMEQWRNKRPVFPFYMSQTA